MENQVVPPPPQKSEEKSIERKAWGELIFVNRNFHPNVPHRIFLRKEIIKVGRHLKSSSKVDIRLHTNNSRRFISRKHATFRRTVVNGIPQYQVEDQGSMCCTYVNNQKILQAHTLKDGDEIRFGGGNRTLVNEMVLIATPTINQDSLLFRFKIREGQKTGKKRKRNKKKKKENRKKKSTLNDSQVTPSFPFFGQPFEKKRKLDDEKEIKKKQEQLERDHERKINEMKKSYAEQQLQEFAKLAEDEKELEKDTLVSKEIISTLRCTICHHFLRDAMMLPCSHSFCKRCLIDHINSQRNNQKTCPTCQTIILAHPIRNRTLDSLMESFVPFMSTSDHDEYTQREGNLSQRDDETIRKFNDLVTKCKNRGKSFFSIRDKWNMKKKKAVRSHLQLKFKQGSPRARYFEVIGFTKQFVQNADYKTLRLACDNLQLLSSTSSNNNAKKDIRCGRCNKKRSSDQKTKDLRQILLEFLQSEYFGL